MTFRESLYAYLTGIPAIAAAVGTRIFPELAEENATTPYIIARIVERPAQTLDAKPPYVDVIADLTVFDRSPEAALATALLLGAPDGSGALANFPQGVMGGGVTVLHSVMTEQQPEDSDEYGLFGVRSTFELTYAP